MVPHHTAAEAGDAMSVSAKANKHTAQTELFNPLVMSAMHLRTAHCMQTRPCCQTCPSSPGQVPRAVKGVRRRQQTVAK